MDGAFPGAGQRLDGIGQGGARRRREQRESGQVLIRVGGGLLQHGHIGVEQGRDARHAEEIDGEAPPEEGLKN